MSKKILVTSTDLMMVQFLIPHVINLAKNDFEVEIACSDVGGRMEEIRQKLQEYVKKIHVVRLVRSPISPSNLKGYQDMKHVIDAKYYDIIWTNEPVMGVVTRLAARKARKRGTKVIYMVHGFHFFKGAPIFNWLIFYPIEKMLASKADMIVTVNREDYQRAKKMNVPQVEYIHGIGINTERLNLREEQRNIRKELGLKEEDVLVLSVGELNENKNQKTILKAIHLLNNPTIHYILCGKGNQQENLEELASELGIREKVHFLGYRMDVVDICSQSDVYVMPSLREGLPVASLEAMYCGLPLVTSNIRGLVDIMEDGKTGYLCEPEDYQAFAEGIKKIEQDIENKCNMGNYNKKVVEPYCVEQVKKEIIELFEKVG